jgi:hypothetical protein
LFLFGNREASCFPWFRGFQITHSVNFRLIRGRVPPKIFLEPLRTDQVKATSMRDVRAPEQPTNAFRKSEDPRVHQSEKSS